MFSKFYMSKKSQTAYQVFMAVISLTALLLGLFMEVAPFVSLDVVSAQNNANTIIQVNATQNNIPITQVDYEVMAPTPYTYTQTSSGQILVGPNFQTVGDGPNRAGNPLPMNVPVNITRIGIGGGVFLAPTAQFPTTSNFNDRVGNPIVQPPSEIQVVVPTQEIPHVVGGVSNPLYFERINDVISIPDMRSYWDLGGNALGAATEPDPQKFMDVLYRNPILPGDLVLVSERFGNTPMSFTPLDQNGAVITAGATVSIAPAGPNLYQWDTRISHQTNVTNQTQWLVLFDASLFYVSNSATVYGWRVNMTTTDGGDGKIILFKESEITLQKTATLLNGEPMAPVLYNSLGDVITYTFTATNTGTTILTNVTITDPLAGMSSLTCEIDGGAVTQPIDELAVGQSLVCTATYVVTPVDLGNGFIENTASVTGTDPNENQVTDTDDEKVFGPDPTSARMVAFEAEYDAGQSAVVVSWETASERDIFGFDLFRGLSENRLDAIQINGEMIQAEYPGLDQSFLYTYLDTAVEPGQTYYYWIEIFGLDSSREPIGPAMAAVPAGRAQFFYFLPVIQH